MNALESFFLYQYHTSIGVYEIDAQSKGELVVGNINRFRRNLDLGTHQET